MEGVFFWSSQISDSAVPVMGERWAMPTLAEGCMLLRGLKRVHSGAAITQFTLRHHVSLDRRSSGHWCLAQ